MNSTPQLRAILFDKLGLVPVKKTKTGPSTDADSLQKMADEHPIVEDLLRYREVEKLRSTYADALPPLIQADGRIHATFKQTDTTTGRISSEAPNLQNVPVRTADGREMRRAFVADRRIRTADRRLLPDRAARTRAPRGGPGADRRLRARCRRAHDDGGGGVRRAGGEGRRRAQRRFAKVVNYGLAYGMEAYGLGQRLDIPTGEAAKILDAYFASFPNVKAYMQQTVGRRASAGTPRRSSVAAARSPSSRPTTSGSARWVSAWRRTPPCRVRLPTCSSWR